MSIILPGIPASIGSIVQDRTLERLFHDSLYPRALYRGEAIPEKWLANLGERQVFTRPGLMPPKLKPLRPGVDPTPNSYDTEQWEVEARQQGDTIPTHMPTSHVALASLFMRNTQQLGLNAAQTMDRLSRNKLYRAYGEGEAMVTVIAPLGTKEVSVSTISGFTEKLQLGRLNSVNPGNALDVTFSNGEAANQVVGFTPNDPEEPFGPGVLSLKNALVAAVPVRTGIFAKTRAKRLRVGGGATVDSLVATNVLTLNDIIAAVTRLRDNYVPPHADGTYHVHLTPRGEQEIFADNQWQRLHQSLPDSSAYKDFAIGIAVGCTFYRNTENPSLRSVSGTLQLPGGAGLAQVAPELGLELLNASGVEITRSIVTGGGVLYEKYLDESQYITEAGVQGKIGQFSIVNGGLAVMTQRIRYMLRAPQDLLQQVVSQTWSWSGDFGVPSDALIGDAARFKRAIIIEHA